MAKKQIDETRTYKGTMRMHEAKQFAIVTWGDTAIIFNGKPTIPGTYKVGRLVENPETKKVMRTWLGVGNDWESAFLNAKIVVPAPKTVAKLEKIVAKESAKK